jgi:ABC-type protease/lipase transport system fused ATPase/permease subunit
MPGTVAQNIARLDPNATPDEVIAAAEAAGIHRLVLNLPKGYNTEIGAGGISLSAGQRQRIGLARALFREPFLVVLDEPNSNLDAEGERALGDAIAAIRQRRGIAIIIAHRPSALQNADLVLVMNNGRTQLFGEKERVMSNLLGGDNRPVSMRADTKVIRGSEQRLAIEKEPSHE